MINNNNEESLIEAGLTRGEARLYLTSLRLGPSSVIELGKHLGLTRQMIYNLLDRLSAKGLMKQVEFGGRRLYQALDPDVLQDRAEELKREMAKLVPMLKTRQALAGALPLITVYESPLSMREWYRQFMREAKKDDDYLIWSTGKTDYWFDLDPDFYNKYLDRSEAVGVKKKMIMPDNQVSRQHLKAVGRRNIEARFIPDGWDEKAEKWVWRDQICYLTIRENATNMIVVESAALAEIEKFDFWQIWAKAKKE